MSDPNKEANAFNLDFLNIAQKYIEEGPQGTPGLQKLRSFVSKMKPSGELFVKKQIDSMSTTKATGLDKFLFRLLNFVSMESPIL